MAVRVLMDTEVEFGWEGFLVWGGKIGEENAPHLAW